MAPIAVVDESSTDPVCWICCSFIASSWILNSRTWTRSQAQRFCLSDPVSLTSATARTSSISLARAKRRLAEPPMIDAAAGGQETRDIEQVESSPRHEDQQDGAAESADDDGIDEQP